MQHYAVHAKKKGEQYSRRKLADGRPNAARSDRAAGGRTSHQHSAHAQPPSEASGRTAEAPQQSQQEGWLALGRPRT
jgi:hypothetical protein